MTPEELRQYYESDFKAVMQGKYRPANARYLQTLRVQRNMSLEDVAKALGTYRMKVCRMESGAKRLMVKDREALAIIFNVHPDSFLQEV